jgi:hypothetical protein
VRIDLAVIQMPGGERGLWRAEAYPRRRQVLAARLEGACPISATSPPWTCADVTPVDVNTAGRQCQDISLACQGVAAATADTPRSRWRAA